MIPRSRRHPERSEGAESRRFALLSVTLAVLALAGSPVSAQGGAVRDTVVHFTDGTMTLEGTLVLPAGKGPWPAAVIIAGSGPTDRDGNSPAGVSTDTYRLLARGLAERGIASLRYDKRGLPSSRGSMNMATTTLADFASDAAAAARLLAARSDIRRVVLVGHSEGGMLAMLATQDSAPIAGLVLVSAAGRDLTTILREQLARQFPPAMIARFDTAWSAYLRGDSVVTPLPGLEPLFLPWNRLFLQSWHAVQPVDLLRGIVLPTLVVQGETDVQVTPVDARALASAKSGIRLVLLPGVNHVLKLASGSTMAEQMSVYTDRTLPLASGVVPAIADFIRSLPRP
jgi:pimeloyl-ACP methyl ester carboxylesterase